MPLSIEAFERLHGCQDPQEVKCTQSSCNDICGGKWAERDSSSVF